MFDGFLMIFMAISQHTKSQTEMHTLLWSVVQDSDLKQVSDAGRQSNLDKRDTSTTGSVFGIPTSRKLDKWLPKKKGTKTCVRLSIHSSMHLFEQILSGYLK
jgi:hypothetical protein